MTKCISNAPRIVFSGPADGPCGNRRAKIRIRLTDTPIAKSLRPKEREKTRFLPRFLPKKPRSGSRAGWITIARKRGLKLPSARIPPPPRRDSYARSPRQHPSACLSAYPSRNSRNSRISMQHTKARSAPKQFSGEKTCQAFRPDGDILTPISCTGVTERQPTALPPLRPRRTSRRGARQPAARADDEIRT